VTRRDGIILPMILILVLLLATAVVTFVRRAAMDRMVVQNRNEAAQAEALARGGVRLAMAVAVADQFPKSLAVLGQDVNDPYLVHGVTANDLGSRLGTTVLEPETGGVLHLTMYDRGSRLNLNALVPYGEDATPTQEAEEFLVALLERIATEVDVGDREFTYEPRAMAENLIDFLDSDSTRLRGGSEDDYYQQQDPPYAALNRPLLSVDELRLVEGFDGPFVEALRPYVTVFPLVGGTGINLNTAPPHVLSLVYHEGQFADEETVRRILETRERGRYLCTDTGASDRCDPVGEVVLGERYPDAPLPSSSLVFTVVSDAQVGDIRRRVEAVIDNSELGSPRLLSWRLR